MHFYISVLNHCNLQHMLSSSISLPSQSIRILLAFVQPHIKLIINLFLCHLYLYCMPIPPPSALVYFLHLHCYPIFSLPLFYFEYFPVLSYSTIKSPCLFFSIERIVQTPWQFTSPLQLNFPSHLVTLTLTLTLPPTPPHHPCSLHLHPHWSLL